MLKGVYLLPIKKEESTLIYYDARLYVVNIHDLHWEPSWNKTTTEGQHKHVV